jgi:hypothetical protein
VGLHFTPAFLAGFSLGGALLVLSRGSVITFFLALPGIFAHEFAHWIVAFVLRSAPSSFVLFPRKESPTAWVLGSVRFEPHWWSAGFVALAPGYLVPTAAWFISLHVMGLNMLGQMLGGYAVLTLLWSALPSGQDWRIAIRYPLGTLVLLGVCALMTAKFAF